MREKKGFLLQTVSQMNTGAIVTGLGFCCTWLCPP